MICWSCNNENTDTNSFCADCGVPLDPKFEKLSSHIDDRIAATLDAKFRDQKLVEYQVTEAVVARLVSWGRGLAILVGAILTVLGYLGFSEISSTSKFVDEAEREIEGAKKEINQAKTQIQKDSKEVANLLQEAKKLENDVESLRSKIDSTERLISDDRAREDLERSFLGWDPNTATFTNLANVQKLRNWLSENGFEKILVPTFLVGAQYAAARQWAVAELTETRYGKFVMYDVPESKVATVVALYELEGASVVKEKQLDGKWRIVAEFSSGPIFAASVTRPLRERINGWLISNVPKNVPILEEWLRNQDPPINTLAGIWLDDKNTSEDALKDAIRSLNIPE